MNRKYFLPILLLLFLLIYFIMPDEKVYYPQEVKDTAFPLEETTNIGVSQSTSGGVYSPQTTSDRKFPIKRIAYETIGSALNTKSRRILAEFEFTEMGAIQVGKYVNGVSGDLRISPNGITARDSAGLTTFSIDGTTGNAVFKGTVQAGSFITDNVQVTDEGIYIYNGGLTIEDEDDTTIIDAGGIVGSAAFSSANALKTSNQTPTYDTWTDITQLVHTITLTRTTPFFFYGAILFVGQTSPKSMSVRISVNDSSYYPNSNGWALTNFVAGEGVWFTVAYAFSLPVGTNIVQIECKGGTVAEDEEVGEESNFGYIRLGK